MREFTDKEREFLKLLIDYKKKGDIQALLLARLLKNRIGLIAIGWDVNEHSITFYSESQKNETNCEYYFDFSDFLYFIEELEEYKLIKVDKHATPDNIVNENLLYDHEEYTTELPKEIQKYIKGTLGSITFYRKIKNSDGEIESFTLSPLSVSQYNVHLSEILDKYASGIICPLPLLNELVKYNFKDIEQRRFEQQLDDEKKRHKQILYDNTKKHREQLKSADKSFKVALLAVLVSAIMPFIIMKCTPDSKMNSTQVEQIESAIKSTKTEYPTKIEVSMPDTITVKDIENRKIINNIHIDNEQTKDAQPK